MPELHVVTGAFGFTGRAIARYLLERGKTVRTLTRRRGGAAGAVGLEVAPLEFAKPADITANLRGTAVLYNTYWVRFDRGAASFARAVENTGVLLRAARDADVGRVVHISVTNPSADSPLPYFRGKAAAEAAVAASGLSYAIVRPSLIFGQGDILINNVAWLVRRFPLFLLPGQGNYRVQPVLVEEVAQLAVEAGEQKSNVTFDAVGPEVLTFRELVEEIAGAMGRHPWVLPAPPALALLACRVVGLGLRDVVLTRDELRGLMANLLVSAAAPTARARFTDWLRQNADTVGVRYASELERHFRSVDA